MVKDTGSGGVVIGAPVFATLGPLHDWDAAILVGLLAAIVIVLGLHDLGPRRR